MGWTRDPISALLFRCGSSLCDGMTVFFAFSFQIGDVFAFVYPGHGMCVLSCSSNPILTRSRDSGTLARSLSTTRGLFKVRVIAVGRKTRTVVSWQVYRFQISELFSANDGKHSPSIMANRQIALAFLKPSEVTQA